MNAAIVTKTLRCRTIVLRSGRSCLCIVEAYPVLERRSSGCNHSRADPGIVKPGRGAVRSGLILRPPLGCEPGASAHIIRDTVEFVPWVFRKSVRRLLPSRIAAKRMGASGDVAHSEPKIAIRNRVLAGLIVRLVGESATWRPEAQVRQRIHCRFPANCRPNLTPRQIQLLHNMTDHPDQK